MGSIGDKVKTNNPWRIGSKDNFCARLNKVQGELIMEKAEKTVQIRPEVS